MSSALLEIVRYDNNTLERVLIPGHLFPLEQAQLDLACRFHMEFRAKCQALQAGAANLRDVETTVFRPLLASNHPTAKATALFSMTRV